jgi:hypothetical protein
MVKTAKKKKESLSLGFFRLSAGRPRQPEEDERLEDCAKEVAAAWQIHNHPRRILLERARLTSCTVGKVPTWYAKGSFCNIQGCDRHIKEHCRGWLHDGQDAGKALVLADSSFFLGRERRTIIMASWMPELPPQAQKRWRCSDTPSLGEQKLKIGPRHDDFIVFVLLLHEDKLLLLRFIQRPRHLAHSH